MAVNSSNKLKKLFGLVFLLVIGGCISQTTHDHFNSFLGKPLENRVMQAGNPDSCIDIGRGRTSCTWRSNAATRTIIYNSEGLGCAWAYDGAPFLGGGLTYNNPYLYSHEECHVCDELEKGEDAVKAKLEKCLKISKDKQDSSY